MGHVPGEHVAEGEEVGAAVVVDHALGIARGPGSVIQADRLPLVRRRAPGELGIALGQEGFVVGLAERVSAFTGQRVIDVDDQDIPRSLFECRSDDCGELAVGNQHLGTAVIEAEGEGGRVQAGVERVENRAGHRHPEMRLVKLRRVGGHDRHRIAYPDPASGECGCEAATAGVGL